MCVCVCLFTVSVVQVNVYIKDSVVLFPQFEDPQYSIIHITEPRCLISELGERCRERRKDN